MASLANCEKSSLQKRTFCAASSFLCQCWSGGSEPGNAPMCDRFAVTSCADSFWMRTWMYAMPSSSDGTFTFVRFGDYMFSGETISK